MTGALLTALFFAGNAVCARRAALHYGGTHGNFLRLLLAVALLGAWAHAAGQGVGGGAFAWFFVSGCVGFGLGGLTMFHALPLLGSNLSMLIVQCGSAVAAALVEWLWLGTRLSAAQAGLAALTLAGVVIGLARSDPAGAKGSMVGRTTRQLLVDVLRRPAGVLGSTFALGITFAVISACAQGGSAVMSRRAFAVLHGHGFFMDAATSAYQRALGGLAVGALALFLIRRGSAAERPATDLPPVPAMAVPP
ncbi:MAG: EamA family transporter, partial [Opitutaceae bacterium]